MLCSENVVVFAKGSCPVFKATVFAWWTKVLISAKNHVSYELARRVVGLNCYNVLLQGLLVQYLQGMWEAGSGR